MDSNLLVPEPTQQDVEVYEAFLQYYLKDRDAKGACLRMGFLPQIAEEYGNKYLLEPYVQRKIAEYDNPTVRDEKHYRDNYARYLAALEREAFTNSNPAARVTALRELIARTAPEQEKGDDDGPRGGVMVVPVIQGADEWGEVAAASQRALKETVRE